MSVVVVGLNHRTGPVELRERLHFPPEAARNALQRLRKQLDGVGAVILSTCNRVELYASYATEPLELCAELRKFLSEWHGIPETEFRDHLYEYTEDEAVGHLFRVACSLDSMVVGENQVLGQVHDAYLLAQAEQSTDKIISALFQKAFSVSKSVRTHTAISEGKVSIGSVAVDLAVSIFMNLEGKTVMIVGSGKMGELTLKTLVSKGAGNLLMVNRSVEKAQELADMHGGEAIALDVMEDHLHRADIVVASTGAPGYILRPDHFHHALKQRAQQPMFVIDIAVPRNVDPAVNDLDNVYVYDVDDLQQVAEQNKEARRQEIDRCIEIVDEGVAQFMHWVHTLVAEPTIVEMSQELNTIRERELAKTLSSMPDLTDKQREEIEYMSKRIVNTILQRPMSQLKREMGHHDPHTVLHLVKRLFGLKETP
ncbi:MAG: glutamyl-tRNA reductase [FCB group bacterium]|jgi:glutamyl-tRNA reductase|nr:glutamyl-tRNA reductase [FCB group bacterium]